MTTKPKLTNAHPDYPVRVPRSHLRYLRSLGDAGHLQRRKPGPGRKAKQTTKEDT